MPLDTHPIQFCLTEIVALGSLGGFLFVVMTLEYAFRWNTGQAARYLPGKPPKRLPAVPTAIVAAPFGRSYSSIPKLSPTAASPQPLVAILVACAASTLAWLSAAGRHLRLAESQKAGIREFLSDPGRGRPGSACGPGGSSTFA